MRKAFICQNIKKMKPVSNRNHKIDDAVLNPVHTTTLIFLLYNMNMKTKRKEISKKIRFEVFKRDHFACKYCGREAPSVILEIDHIKPIVEGGDNSLFNLVTACKDCNSGKGGVTLENKQEILKQKQELNKLQEERDQLAMLQEWRENLKQNNTDILNYFSQQIKDACHHHFELNDMGLSNLNKYIKKYENKELLDAIFVSFEKYYKDWKDDNEKKELFEKAFKYVPRIISTERAVRDIPELKDAFYCRGILRNRLNYVNEVKAKEILLELLRCYNFTIVKNLCLRVNNWTDFVAQSSDLIDKAESMENIKNDESSRVENNNMSESDGSELNAENRVDDVFETLTTRESELFIEDFINQMMKFVCKENVSTDKKYQTNFGSISITVALECKKRKIGIMFDNTSFFEDDLEVQSKIGIISTFKEAVLIGENHLDVIYILSDLDDVNNFCNYLYILSELEPIFFTDSGKNNLSNAVPYNLRNSNVSEEFEGYGDIVYSWGEEDDCDSCMILERVCKLDLDWKYYYDYCCKEENINKSLYDIYLRYVEEIKKNAII